MLKFVKCRFSRFSRFKPLYVLLCIIVHRKGNNANLGQEIVKNRYFYVFSKTYLFGEPFLVGFWSNPSCAWMTALNRHFFAISLFYRCRFAFMVAFVPNRVDFPFSSQSVCIKPASYADLLDMFCIVSSICDNRQLLYVIWESYFWIACMPPESDVRFIGFEMRLWKSFINRESSFDAKREIRCDGLVGFLHRVRKSDVWSDNAYFISAQIRCGAAHLPVVWLTNLSPCLSDATWLCVYFIADISSNSRLICQS